LGVHISFVRSIAMDSWTEKQLALMKNGGNKKCNDYLQSKGIEPRTPVKAKYESDHAQLYKLILKAKVEGTPIPTSLPPPKKRVAHAPASAPPNFGSGGGGMMGSNDPNGLERMTGETEQQYIVRQTRLREEARARMQAKFGNTGGKMSGVGSSSMQGVGSDPNYNPNSSGYGAPDMDNVINNVSGAFSSGLSMVSSVVTDQSTRASVSNLGNTVSSYGGSFWNTLKTTVGDVATAVAQPDSQSDGLASLQRDIQSHKPSTSKYDGFGSSNATTTNNNNNNSNPSSSMFENFGMGGMSNMGGMSQQQPMGGAATMPSSGGVGGGGGGGALQEAPGLPTEDRNGMERLTGETDEQYVMRQTRLRDEAKARMAAKFGGGGLSSAGPSSSSYTPTTVRPPSAPSSGNAFGSTMNNPPSSFPSAMSLSSNTTPKAPSSAGSGLYGSGGKKTPPRKNSKDDVDFFANFGA
jgi:hypothetical protein